MTKIRNLTTVKKVMARDLGLCRCCGFEASEVHHIVPLISGGEDYPSNMISLCWTCHTHAPNSKFEFYQYMKSGGAKTYLSNGKIVDLAEQAELKSNGGIKFQEAFSLGRKVLLSLKKSCAVWAMEKYNPLDCNQVEDVDFREESLKSEQNKDNFPREDNLDVRKV